MQTPTVIELSRLSPRRLDLRATNRPAQARPYELRRATVRPLVHPRRPEPRTW